MRRLANYALFQAGWFGCVLGGVYGATWGAVSIAAAVVLLNLRFLSENPRADLRTMVIATALGFALDSVHLAAGVLALNGAPRFPFLCPIWLAALWAVFGTMLRGSLSGLAGRYWLSALLGAVGGPLSYEAGVKMGAMRFGLATWQSVAALAVSWAVATPLLVRLAHGRRAT